MNKYIMYTYKFMDGITYLKSKKKLFYKNTSINSKFPLY